MCESWESWAERREFPLPAYVGMRSFAPLLKIIPDKSWKGRKVLAAAVAEVTVLVVENIVDQSIYLNILLKHEQTRDLITNTF